MELDILETELLPSDVVKVKFYRPPNMKVLSGQWIRFTCTAIQPEEYHSFTLTSASRSLWPRISAQCSISCSSRAVSSSAARTRASAAALASSLALRGTWRAGRCRNNQATRPPCPYDIPPELRLT